MKSKECEFTQRIYVYILRSQRHKYLSPKNEIARRIFERRANTIAKFGDGKKVLASDECWGFDEI